MKHYYDEGVYTPPEMIEVPSNVFVLGCTSKQFVANNCELPAHSVYIDTFAISSTPITVEQYMEFLKDRVYDNSAHMPNWMNVAQNPETGNYHYYKRESNIDLDDNHPITGINYKGAEAYCEWLSRKTNQHYRLPTSAEWEYAARAGTKTAFYHGDNPALLNDYAWSNSNSKGKMHSVAEKIPNHWGLYDTLGLVWEMTSDYFDEFYYADCVHNSITFNPTGPEKEEGVYFTFKVIRGGSFRTSPRFLRISYRNKMESNKTSQDIGFRVARNI